MEVKKEENGFLDLLTQPGFCVKENRITAVNQAAQCLLVNAGTDVRELLHTGAEEYAAFQGGCLYLTLELAAGVCGASVIRLEDQDVFILDHNADDALRALSLAASVLREPLSGMMLSAKNLSADDPAQMDALAQLNRSLHQMLRLLGNMSDAGSESTAQMTLRDIPAVISEIFDRAESSVSRTGHSLCFINEVGSVQGLMDEERMERAILNILSNAIKFSPEGSPISARLTRHGRMLTLRIRDSGSGIAQEIRQDLFHRYLRHPGIEESRQGLGLGMVMVHNAASRHGGTVLIDQPDGIGTRISITLAIRQDGPGTLRSPVLRVDYSGSRDHALVELSECLPLDQYYQD